MVRILVEDLPANVGVRYHFSRRTDFDAPTVTGTTIDLTYMITTEEDAEIELWAVTPAAGAAPARGQVPENMRKPYRITVTRTP
jgi:hypothetical protein